MGVGGVVSLSIPLLGLPTRYCMSLARTFAAPFLKRGDRSLGQVFHDGILR